MGGLSCAAVLSRLGRKVLVLDQHNDVAGGGTHQFDLEGFRFDSGLHYTVPWSVPIFALTCGKKESAVCQFDLMGDTNKTVDKIHLHTISENPHHEIATPFEMKIHELHRDKLYNDFPDDRGALDRFMALSDRAMLFVKIFIAMRLFPQWIQNILWKLVPSSILDVVSQTAEDILPRLTSNKRLISLLSGMWIDTGHDSVHSQPPPPQPPPPPGYPV
jgi:all-trans-retinol 13,14-reductase